MSEIFESRFVRELPGDPETDNYLRQVSHACYSRVSPTAVTEPSLVAHSQEVATLLGLQASQLKAGPWLSALAGNETLRGMAPFAACYGGHQFGNWAGQLGDGRAISLGEMRDARGALWELQLKGAGPTPYSRRADGRAVMRSSVREFLCSEAMHHLGVPTTRALSLVGTGDAVVRDMLYDGNARPEPGAVVCRVAPSFLRFGNFELCTSRGDADTLRTLVEFTIRHFFPESLPENGSALGPDHVASFFGEVCRRTARMVVEWMRVGFVHGVMNTDNMSILGLTIDYGPYGWMDDFDPTWTPNTTDAQGRRYRFGNQPRVCEWNLAQLGNALVPLVGEAAPLEEGLRVFAAELEIGEAKMMAKKLGLVSLSLESEEGTKSSDRLLVEELNEMLMQVETDMTLFYRSLAKLDLSDAGLSGGATRMRQELQPAYYDESQLTPEVIIQVEEWLSRYAQRVRRDGSDLAQRGRDMNLVNPKYVLRNYIAQLAIDDAEKGDGTTTMELLEALRHPYDEQPRFERYSKKRPEWARHRPGCSMLSCSS